MNLGARGPGKSQRAFNGGGGGNRTLVRTSSRKSLTRRIAYHPH